MIDVCTAKPFKDNTTVQVFTKEQYAQLASMLPPAEILAYIANHEEEYRLFQEREKQEWKVQK